MSHQSWVKKKIPSNPVVPHCLNEVNKILNSKCLHSEVFKLPITISAVNVRLPLLSSEKFFTELRLSKYENILYIPNTYFSYNSVLHNTLHSIIQIDIPCNLPYTTLNLSTVIFYNKLHFMIRNRNT